MSENSVPVIIELEPGSLNDELIQKIIHYPKKLGDKLLPVYLSKFESESQLLSQITANVIEVKQTKKLNSQKLFFVPYFFGDVVFNFPKSQNEPETILVERRRQNPSNLIPQGVSLKEIYFESEVLFNFLKYVLDLFGEDVISCRGEWEAVMHERMESGPGGLWINYFSSGEKLPEKYSYSDDVKLDWYKKVTVKGGSLLISSPLAWADVVEEGQPPSVSWSDLEKRWHQLEKERK